MDPGHRVGPVVSASWPAVAQLLDEQHLVAASPSEAAAMSFGLSLGGFLRRQADTEVVPILGQFVRDVSSFCRQVEPALGRRPIARRLDGANGVIDRLRRRYDPSGAEARKFRYYLWHDADVLMRIDRALFDDLVDTLAGVAAEAEFVSEDMLLIHRVVVMGKPALFDRAADPAGPFRAWRGGDGLSWGELTGVPGPRFARFGIDLMAVVA